MNSGAVLKVGTGFFGGFLRPLVGGDLQSQNYFCNTIKTLFAFSIISHEYKVEFAEAT